MPKTETNVDTLVINQLSQEAYQAAVAAGEINQNELYMTPAQNVPTKTSELENDSGYVTEQDISGKLDTTGGTMTGDINVKSSDNGYYGWVGASGLQLYNAYDPNNATTLFRINPYYTNSPRVYFKLPTSAEGYFLSFYKGTSLEVFSVSLNGSVKIQEADGYYINLQANKAYPYEQLITTGSNPLALGCSYLNMKNKIIKNIGDPENDTDAANKKYVDDTVSAHSDDTTIHVTADEKSAWNSKANASDMSTITLHKWTEVV